MAISRFIAVPAIRLHAQRIGPPALIQAAGPDADERVPRPEPEDSSLDVAWLVRRAAAGDLSAWSGSSLSTPG